MPGNAAKKMGMMQLGLLTVAALLLAGALVVKTKRDAVAEVPVAVAPAAGEDNADSGFSRPAHQAADSAGGTAGASGGSDGVSAGGHGGGHAKRGDAAGETPAMQEADCSAYQAWVGKKLDRAAVEATGKPHRILKPGDMMTMDFNPERINVETDEKGEMVTRVFCG